MLEEALEILRTCPSNALDLFKRKYKFLFKDKRLLLEVLKWEWSESNYKSVCFFVDKIIINKLLWEEQYKYSEMLPIYTDFQYYIYNWFFSTFEKLPFESWSHLGKEGFDLLKILFKEGQLENYKKDKRYIELHGKCEKKIKVILKDEHILPILLHSREGQAQYEGLMLLSFLVYKNTAHIAPGTEYFKEVLPVYKDVQKYMYDWRKFYVSAIMFEDWEDLREEGIDLLKRLIEENRLSQFQEDVRYREFVKKFPVRYNELLRRDYQQVNNVLKTDNKDLKDREDIQKFIDVLDQFQNDRNTSFFKQYGRDILREISLLLAVISKEWSEKKLDKLAGLAWIVFCTISANYSGERETFRILPIYKHFKEYMYAGCHFFENRGVPFKEWSDLAKEQDGLLKTLIKENKLEQFKEDARYLYWYSRRIASRTQELIKKGYKDLEFTDTELGI